MGITQGGRGLVRAGVTAALCTAMLATQAVGEPLAAKPAAGNPAAAKPTKAKAPVSAPPLTVDQRTLHLLNRFTFGPRPGDVATVEKEGLNRWFDQQLHPDSISDATLDLMLQEYPAMTLSIGELMTRLPSPNMLRRDTHQEVPLPTDPAEHAIYATAEWKYQQRLQMQAAAAAAGASAATNANAAEAGKAIPANGMAPGSSAAPGGNTMAVETMATTASRAARLANVERYQRDPNAILSLAPDARMAAIYRMPPEQFALLAKGLNGEQREALALGLTPTQKETLVALATSPERVVQTETLDTRMLRDVYSDRQLQAVMTDFWLNHFNVYLHKDQGEPFMLNSFENQTILPHALGKFEDLLVAVAQSPAMELYLDNWQSIGPDSRAAGFVKKAGAVRPNGKIAKAAPKGINENYARELMELHTLGVQCEVSADKPKGDLDRSCGSGYTQADVQAVAAVLTGWGVTRPYGGTLSGVGGNSGDNQAAFSFIENRHEPGDKKVLGHTIPAGGENEGLEVLHLLATSPATAQFISHKLAVRFVSDNPPRALEDRMAATFLATGGDIAAVLKTMERSPEFWAPPAYRAKVKTPIEFVVSAVRASDTSVLDPLDLVQALDKLGMPMYGMQTPNGYGWQADDWVSANALINRMNFAMVLSGGLLPGTELDWARLVGPDAAAAKIPSVETENRLEVELVGMPVSDRTRTVVMEQADRPGQAQAALGNFAGAPTKSAGSAGQATALPAKQGAGQAAGGFMLTSVGPRKKQARVGNGGFSMTQLASQTQTDTPVSVMAGLLMGSPEFQRR